MFSSPSLPFSLTFPSHPACLELVPFYAATSDMAAEEFARFTDPSNFTAQVLLMHFWMLVRLLESHVLGDGRYFAIRDDIARRWVEKAACRLPQSHRQYAMWPLGMARSQGFNMG